MNSYQIFTFDRHHTQGLQIISLSVQSVDITTIMGLLSRTQSDIISDLDIYEHALSFMVIRNEETQHTYMVKYILLA